MSVIRVIGVQEVSGRMENGVTFDFARVHAISMLDPTSAKASGFAGIELRGLPDIYDKYLGFKFKPEGVPFEVDIQQVAVGKGQFKDTIISMTPVVEVAKAAPVVEVTQAAPVVEVPQAAPVVEVPQAAPVVEVQQAQPKASSAANKASS